MSQAYLLNSALSVIINFYNFFMLVMGMVISSICSCVVGPSSDFEKNKHNLSYEQSEFDTMDVPMLSLTSDVDEFNKGLRKGLKTGAFWVDKS